MHLLQDDVIDVLPTKLLEIPLSDRELADMAYYDALGEFLARSPDD
jgi:hypothetical protein